MQKNYKITKQNIIYDKYNDIFYIIINYIFDVFNLELSIKKLNKVFTNFKNDNIFGLFVTFSSNEIINGCIGYYDIDFKSISTKTIIEKLLYTTKE